SPSTTWRSVLHTPHACTRTSACPGPGSGCATVCSSSGSRTRSSTMARTPASLAGPVSILGDHGAASLRVGAALRAGQRGDDLAAFRVAVREVQVQGRLLRVTVSRARAARAGRGGARLRRLRGTSAQTPHPGWEVVRPPPGIDATGEVLAALCRF